MICQKCNKNTANVKYTEIINGEKKEMMLCEECSHELGLDNMNFSMPIDFSSFFGGLLDEQYNSPEYMPLFQTVKELKCSNCNMTYDDFINQGKVGCEECYDVFSNKIDHILKRLHGHNKHTGRKSVGLGLDQSANQKMQQNENNVGANCVRPQKETTQENKLEKLQKDLREAIAEERYEDAAKIRDEIKSLENK